MSRYERYDEVAVDYDRNRSAIGAEVIARCLAAHDKPLGALHLLDAGCGTGNYSAALADHVGRITALDLSPEMLVVAGVKLAAPAAAGRIEFHEGSIEALPFPDAGFDAVMFNQVLHHLEAGDDPAYGGHARALAEAYRVLRPGGVVVLNVCTHEQLEEGFWYYRLIPGALAAVLRRCVPAGRLEEILDAAGFALRDRVVPLDGVMQGAGYFDPRGPLDPEWRRSDSIWALATAAELAAAEAELRALERDGRLEAYLAEADAPRRELGQLTFFAAIKE